MNVLDTDTVPPSALLNGARSKLWNEEKQALQATFVRCLAVSE